MGGELFPEHLQLPHFKDPAERFDKSTLPLPAPHQLTEHGGRARDGQALSRTGLPGWKAWLQGLPITLISTLSLRRILLLSSLLLPGRTALWSEGSASLLLLSTVLGSVSHNKSLELLAVLTSPFGETQMDT